MSSNQLKCTFKLFCACTLLFVSAHIEAAPKKINASKSANKTEDLQNWFKKYGFKKDEVGIFAADSSADEPMFDHNGQKKFVPASISKLVTAAAVMDAFPPATRIKTLLVSEKKVESGTLKGNLYFVGGGDPSFVSENMWYLVNALVRTGVNKIEGDLVVDDSLFDQVRFDESRQKERVDRAYDAPVSAVSFNWNSVNVFVRPTEKGHPALVYVDPENDYIQLNAQVKTTSGSEIEVDRESGTATTDRVVVRGSIASGSEEKVVYKSVTEPSLWAGACLKYFLSQRGIEFKGSVKKGVAPKSQQILASSESKPIEDMISDMNKFSNNFVAEMLIKLVSSQNQKPATLKNGVTYMQDFLKRINITDAEVHIENPSGLTKENKFTARGLWKLLNYQKNNFAQFPEYLKSLPIAGVDGTLKKRMKEKPRLVRAKTGLLTGVAALAGYTQNSGGETVSFVFMYNGGADGARVREAFDDLALRISE